MLNSLRGRLKESTASLHAQVEDFLSFQNMEFKDYIEVLQIFHRFYMDFENSVEPFLTHRIFDAFDWSERRKLPWIEQDLFTLGCKSTFKKGDENPLIQFHDAYEALGAFYVVEGSTLGGQVISRLLKERFALEAHNGARFYLGYQQETGVKWRRFLDLLEGHDALEESRILEGAKKAFSTLLTALKSRSPIEKTRCSETPHVP